MKYRNRISHFLVLILFWGIAALSPAGCRPHPENSLFAFLFPEDEKAAETPAGRRMPAESDMVEEPYAEAAQTYLLVSHKPYIERKCVACHEGAGAFVTPIFGPEWDGVFRKGGGKPGPLTLPVKELCLKCHQDLTLAWVKERGLYLHKTAAEGDCVKCHVPHQGRHPFRLIDDADQLCVSCHNAKEKIGIPICVRELNVTGPCLSCHNAHLGKTKALLKKDYAEPEHEVVPEPDIPEENPPEANTILTD